MTREAATAPVRTRRRQSLPLRARGVVAILATACFTVLAQARPAGAAPASSCPLPAHAYEERQYVVREIRVDAVVDVLGVVRSRLASDLAEAQARLDTSGKGLHEGAPFRNVDGYFALQEALARRLFAAPPGQRVSFSSIAPYLDACDDAATPPMLDVVYKVFTTESLSYASSVFEKRFERPDRSVLPSMLATTLGQAFPEPTLGYNDSRGLFAGARFSHALPTRAFNNVDATFTASGSSATIDASVSGSRDFDRLIGHVDWTLGTRYSNVPASELQLKNTAAWLGQVAAATKPLGPGVVLRFGGALEDGASETTLSEIDVPVGALDAHHAGKLYGGATLNRGRQSWSASYGLQLGTGESAWRIDYGKHVIDAVYNARFLAREHRPLTVDARMTGGWLSGDAATLPLSERFFGGNATEDFIRGNTWRINAAPVIRSFPQNRFSQTAALPGGESFLSVNVTLAQTIWSRPAIPAEVGRDADLNVQFESAILVLRNTTVADSVRRSKEFNAATALLDARFTPLLTELSGVLSTIPPAGLPAETETALSDARDDVDSAIDAAAGGRIAELLLGLAGNEPLIDTITGETEALRRLLPAHSDTLGRPLPRFETARAEVLEAYENAQALGSVSPEGFVPSLRTLAAIEVALTRVREQVKLLPTALPTNSPPRCDDWPNAVEALGIYAQTGIDEIAAARVDAMNRQGFTKTNLQKLSKGLGAMFPARLSSVVSGIRRVEALSACVGANTAPLTADAQFLVRLQHQLESEYDRLATPPLEHAANRDLSYALRSLDVIFREMNLASISPVLMFDMARIGPDGGGLRYGLGGGVKFSIVTLDVTAGYSVTLRRQPGDSPGAFALTLDVSDLFR
jgi:hypothetical protein